MSDKKSIFKRIFNSGSGCGCNAFEEVETDEKKCCADQKSCCTSDKTSDKELKK